MNQTSLSEIKEHEIIKGYHGKFVHSEHMTMAYWRIEAGYSIPVHHHEHEQVVNLLEGEFELEVNGELRRLTAGEVVVLHANVPHGGKAITACRILDVFTPVREDYRF